MDKKLIETIISGSYSLVLHIVLLGLFIIGMDSPSTPHVIAQPKVNIVQATVVNESQVLQEMAKLQEFEDKKKQRELDRQAEVDKQLKETQDALALKKKESLEQKKQAEKEKQKRELKVKQEKEKIKKLEQQRKLEDKKRLKAKADRKIEEDKKFKAEQERRVAEEKRKLAEADRQAEERRIKEAEKARKLAEEKERQAVEARKRAEKLKEEAARQAQREEADRMIQQGLEAEFAKEELERSEKRVADVVNRYSEIIRQKVSRNWSKPASSESGLETTLRVALLPSGDVKSVSIIKKSGNELFDRSVRTAIYKAAPFTLPTDLAARKKFKNFQFIFKPE
ncbi:MAG: cell envelope integrity protein TolA [Piscirickettsiaceae bacterium]|nr:cell envelope integrity protein TolA [Piscirickettsiaceae bacterium]